MNSQTRNVFIDVLRLVFACLIALFHMVEIFPLQVNTHISLFHQGAIGVEFFSIVAGFYLASHIFKEIAKNMPDQNIGLDTIKYVGRKYLEIFPYNFFAYLLAMAVFLYFSYQSLYDTVQNIVFSFSDLFMLNMTGLNCLWINVPAWYLSSLFMVLLVAYPLLRKNFDLTAHVLAPLFVLTAVGWMSHETGTMRGVLTWYGFIYKGTIRIAIGIMLGVVCFEISRCLQTRNVSKRTVSILTFIELVSYLIAICYSCIVFSEQGYFVVLFILAVAVTLTLSQQTRTKEFKMKHFQILSKLSLAIFINQCYCNNFLTNVILRYNIKHNNYCVVAVYMLMVLVFSLLSIVIVEKVKTTLYKVKL